MGYWGKRINVSKEAAIKQVAIINNLSKEKRCEMAFSICNFGISRTHQWIKSQYPEFSELEVRLEFVGLMCYKDSSMKEEHLAVFPIHHG